MPLSAAHSIAAIRASARIASFDALYAPNPMPPTMPIEDGVDATEALDGGARHALEVGALHDVALHPEGVGADARSS